MDKDLNWGEIIKKAEEIAVSESEKYGTPIKLHFILLMRKVLNYLKN